MRIIQSFWSGNSNEFTNNYGWHSYKYNWLSWLLSCHQLVKYHKEVELYTDRFGYEILIEKLQLPYTKVHVVLDELNNYHKDLWAISKIKVYQMQNEPFLHVDGDVFVWESLEDKIKKSPILTQNLEILADYYGKMWNEISPSLTYMPIELENYHNHRKNYACNMGVVGGYDIDFFKEYAKTSIDFVDKNSNAFSKINCLNFNLFFEQVLFYQLAKNQKKEINYLFDKVYVDGEYTGFAEFQEVPDKSYLHLLGAYKRNRAVCKAMEVYIMKNYPESYSKIAALINEAEDNENEIQFLTKQKVAELISDFDFEIKTRKSNPTNYLLKRDLYLADKYNKLQELLLHNKNFNILLLDGFQKVDIMINNKEVSFLEIDEQNSIATKYNLDDLDEVVLYELADGIQYFDFISNMFTYFDDDSEEMKNDSVLLLNKLLGNYIAFKIIAIYE